MSSDNHKKVITFPSSAKSTQSGHLWSFLSYVDTGGEDVIDGWYKAQSLETRLAFDKMLKQNVKIENHMNWVGYRHKMKGKKVRKVFELEFSAEQKANRILCVFDGEKRTVMLCACYHKNKIWYPSGAIEMAAKRAEEVKNGTAKLKIREIKTDS